jgi:flagellar motility protein MotE (MotC chaperone)
MDYETLDSLRQNNPAWKLLKADHAALIVSFLHRTYIKPNVRTLNESELASRLEDTLFHLRRELGPDAFPRGATAYLDDWASDKHGWLRKYYAPDSDEPSFDITPATEQVIDWIGSLSQRPFIGTESRLLTVFELLRQLAEGTETDPKMRIAELERRRAELDGEIASIREGVLPLIDATGVRERFLQIASTAQGLLSDFRAVEQNFRALDRATRERIATWEGGKGDLLLEIFGKRDAIADSDQGKSFRAFWDFLMSPQRQEELTSLLEKVFALEAIRQLEPDRRVLRIHYDWLAAGEVTQRTIAKLSAELRRYLDDKAWLENRRIMEILREIEIKALTVRDDPPRDAFMELDDIAPDISLVMDRPLFTPPHKPVIDDSVSFSALEDIPADALFDCVFVDKERLAAHIRRALQRRDQVSLSEIVEANPLEHGLAELIAYLALASEDPGAVIDDRNRQTLVWTDARLCG